MSCSGAQAPKGRGGGEQAGAGQAAGRAGMRFARRRAVRDFGPEQSAVAACTLGMQGCGAPAAAAENPPECLNGGVPPDAALLAQRLLLLAVHGGHLDHAVQRLGHLAPLGRKLAAVPAPRRVKLNQPHPAVAVTLGEGIVGEVLQRSSRAQRAAC